MSTVPDYLIKKRAKEFDELVNRAHDTRVLVVSEVRTKGSFAIAYRTEEGLSYIANKYRDAIRDTRSRKRKR